MAKAIFDSVEITVNVTKIAAITQVVVGLDYEFYIHLDTGDKVRVFADNALDARDLRKAIIAQWKEHDIT